MEYSNAVKNKQVLGASVERDAFDVPRYIDLKPYGFPGYLMYSDGNVFSQHSGRYMSDPRGTLRGTECAISYARLFRMLYQNFVDDYPTERRCTLCKFGRPDLIITDDGSVWSTKQTRWLKCLRGKGKAYFTDGEDHTVPVYYAVATCFIPNPREYSHVVAIDGDLSNIDVGNLQWSVHQHARSIYHNGNRDERLITRWMSSMHHADLKEYDQYTAFANGRIYDRVNKRILKVASKHVTLRKRGCTDPSDVSNVTMSTLLRHTFTNLPDGAIPLHKYGYSHTYYLCPDGQVFSFAKMGYVSKNGSRYYLRNTSGVRVPFTQHMIDSILQPTTKVKKM